MAAKKPTTRKRRPQLPAVKVREFQDVQRILGRVASSLAHCDHETPQIMNFLEDLFLIGYGAGAWASRKVYDEGWRPRKKLMPPAEEVSEAQYDLEWAMRAIHQDVPKSALN